MYSPQRRRPRPPRAARRRPNTRSLTESRTRRTRQRPSFSTRVRFTRASISGSKAPMSYQPMPPAPQGGPPPAAARDPRNAPSTVRNAVRLMLVLAALGVIGLIIVFADKSALRKAIEDANPSYDSS